MDTQEILTARIEAYLEGSLDVAQKSEFEHQLSSDPDLQTLVSRHRKAGAAINYALRQAMKEKLKTIDQEATQPTLRRSYLSPGFQRLAAAASFLILIAVGLHLYAYRTYNAEAVATRLFAITQTEQLRGSEAPVSSLDQAFTKAEQLFRAGRYEDAAQEYLQISREESLLKGRAEWNLALCYYTLDPASADFKILFDQILADPNHDYHAQAVALRDAMHGVLYKIVNR